MSDSMSSDAVNKLSSELILKEKKKRRKKDDPISKGFLKKKPRSTE